MNECAKARWSTRELERQIGSLLYERLARSRDEDALARLVSVSNTTSQVFASRYQLYLPTEDELRAELIKERSSLELTHDFSNKAPGS